MLVLVLAAVTVLAAFLTLRATVFGSDPDVAFASCMKDEGWPVEPRQDVRVAGEDRDAFVDDARACAVTAGYSDAATGPDAASPDDSVDERGAADTRLAALVACMQDVGWALPDPVRDEQGMLRLADHDLLDAMPAQERERMRQDGERCETQSRQAGHVDGDGGTSPLDDHDHSDHEH